MKKWWERWLSHEGGAVFTFLLALGMVVAAVIATLEYVVT